MPVSAAEAQQILRQDVQNWNNNRLLPPTLPRLRKMMAEDVVFICNVGPWARIFETGSLRGYIVPAYDKKNDSEGLGYVKGPEIPAIFRTAKVVDESNFGYVEDDGLQVAEEAIGIGFGLPPSNSVVPEGFFVWDGREPIAPKIEKARAELSKYFDRLIEESRDAYDKGPEERKNVIGDRQLLAARTKGIDEPWVHHKHTQENVRCEMCGKYNPSGVAKCACGSILDVDLYRRLMAKQREMQEEVELEVATRPKGK